MPRSANSAFNKDNNKFKTSQDNINRKKVEAIYNSVRTDTTVKKNGEQFVNPVGIDTGGFLAKVGGYNVNSYELLMNVARGQANIETPCITVDSSSVLVTDNCCNLLGSCQIPTLTYDLFEGPYLKNNNTNLTSADSACLPPSLNNNNNLVVDASNVLAISNEDRLDLTNSKLLNLKLHSKMLIKCKE